MQALKIKTVLAILILTSLFSVATLVLPTPHKAEAQSAEAISYCSKHGAGSSEWAVCTSEYTELEQGCRDLYDTGGTGLQRCLDGIPTYMDTGSWPGDRDRGGIWCVPVNAGSSDPFFVNGDECPPGTVETSPPGDESTPGDEKPKCDNGTPDNPDDDVDGVQLADGTCLAYTEGESPLEDLPIFVILGRVIQFLLASVGVGLTAVIVLAGFQYITANGDPQKTSSAKKKIAFAITGVIMFIFSGALMNWLIPGGIIP